MKKISTLFIIFVFAFLSISALSGIKERMKERLPKIMDLKAKGLVGENNKGYLEWLKGQESKEGKVILDAENADRKKVYEHIAKKQGTTAELVGKLRAKKIMEKALAGHWIQGADGKWAQKK